MPVRRILCPIDFSDFSRHAFDRALAIATSVFSCPTCMKKTVSSEGSFAFSL